MDVKTLQLETAAYMANKIKSLSTVQNALKWLINEDEQLLEEKMFSHNTTKDASADQLVSIINNKHRDKQIGLIYLKKKSPS